MQALTREARMKNPAAVIPDAMRAIMAMNSSVKEGGVPPLTLELAHLRASQINGCSSCVDSGSRSARKAGETDERQLAALILSIATTNLFNRLNVATGQVAGSRG